MLTIIAGADVVLKLLLDFMSQCPIVGSGTLQLALVLVGVPW